MNGNQNPVPPGNDPLTLGGDQTQTPGSQNTPDYGRDPGDKAECIIVTNGPKVKTPDDLRHDVPTGAEIAEVAATRQSAAAGARQRNGSNRHKIETPDIGGNGGFGNLFSSPQKSNSSSSCPFCEK